MSFVREQARAALWRWREAGAGAALALLGLWWIAGPGGLLGLVGWALALAGAALAVVGVQRARFRQEGEGPGVVRIDEGEIVYFGPLSGGSVAARDLERLTFDPTARPPSWVLSQQGRAPLCIPVNALGAEALFDAFAALPGLRTERMLAELAGRAHLPVVIWERVSERPPSHRLH